MTCELDRYRNAGCYRTPHVLLPTCLCGLYFYPLSLLGSKYLRLSTGIDPSALAMSFSFPVLSYKLFREVTPLEWLTFDPRSPLLGLRPKCFAARKYVPYRPVTFLCTGPTTQGGLGGGGAGAKDLSNLSMPRLSGYYSHLANHHQPYSGPCCKIHPLPPPSVDPFYFNLLNTVPQPPHLFSQMLNCLNLTRLSFNQPRKTARNCRTVPTAVTELICYISNT